MATFDELLSLRDMQKSQPWTVPYSSEFMKCVDCYRGDSLPHLYGTHAVLHAMKTVGKLAAVFEALDHREGGFGTPPAMTLEEIQTIIDMSADMVTMALRLANLYHFDLYDSLCQRVKEKNGVGFTKRRYTLKE